MTGVLLAALAGYGAFLLYTGTVLGWRGYGFGPAVEHRRPARTIRWRDWQVRAGLEQFRPWELLAVATGLAALGAAVGTALFAGAAPAAAGALSGAAAPLGAARARRQRRQVEAREAWPRLLEELRIQTTAMGRSIPQALFDVGRRAPGELRPAFDAAHREWLLTTDLDRTLAVLKGRLADPTADMVCETLLVAHEVGGTDVDRVLAALVEDRIRDLQGRKDARARQAGARFARWFVLVVPLGMALVGTTIGTGRQAYATPAGQAAVLAALGAIGVCWWWAGRLLQLPDDERVFAPR